jgi:hypothetical protein
MRILLDESIPRKLRNDFGGEHEVWTVRDKGWLGKKNGELLRFVAEDSFDLFITVDRNLRYQQNLQAISLTIIILCGSDNRHDTVKKLIPKMFQQLALSRNNSVVEIY